MTMPSPAYILSLLTVVCFSFATYLDPRYLAWEGSRSQSDDVLSVAMGDSRRMFANEFFTKADVYFHSGYYPTIFDQKKIEEKSHMLEDEHDEHDHDHDHHPGEAEHDEHEEHEGDFLGPPKDWIDRFSRNFYNAHHTHLGAGGNEREILPWLQLSADLDPHRIETYTVAAYWLRSRLNKPKEAEQFLREGLRSNPDSYEILLEIGLVYYASYHDVTRARNVWELALKKWIQRESRKEKPDNENYEKILDNLIGLEEKAQNWAKCVEYLQLVKKVSPISDKIEQQIQDLKQKHNLP
jgi:tetratricopeptide (TPR) repeat protein